WHAPAAEAPPPEPSPPAELPEPVIDLQQLQALRDLQDEGDPDMLEELIEMFLSDAQRSMQAIRDAVARQDAALLTRAARARQGSSANMGAKPLSALSLKMEEAARAG